MLIIVIGGIGNLSAWSWCRRPDHLPELLRAYSDYRLLLYGLALVAMILLRPRGSSTGASGLLGSMQPPRLAMMLVFERSPSGSAHSSLSRLIARLPAGEITSIIGPNGAGKSTLVNLAAGSYRVSSGRILLDGAELQRRPKHRIARAGLARTYQNSGSSTA